MKVLKTIPNKGKIMLESFLQKAHEHWDDAVLLLTISPSPMAEIGKMVVVAALSSFATNLITTAKLEERIIYIQDTMRQTRIEQEAARQTIGEMRNSVVLIQYRLDQQDKNRELR